MILGWAADVPATSLAVAVPLGKAGETYYSIMRARSRIAQVLLWLAVLGLSVWVGGTLYQMLVIMPM